MRKAALLCGVLFLGALFGCSAEVGSERWCKEVKAKPEGEWTFNEAKAYAKHCLFK